MRRLGGGAARPLARRIVGDAHSDDNGVEAFARQARPLRERARRFAFEMDFSFLMRPENASCCRSATASKEHQLDESCYDLLASEARLTSLFAIAKGDLPTEHWFRLGRPIVEIGFQGALMSWSGSMFEYLMPPLVMKEPHGGILKPDQLLSSSSGEISTAARRTALGHLGSAYNARDREMTYQYTNFGVPGLGAEARMPARTRWWRPMRRCWRRSSSRAEAVVNLKRLRPSARFGRYGYYDAVDFTPQRVPEGKRHAVVRNYMAHH